MEPHGDQLGNDALTLRIGYAPDTPPYLALVDGRRALPLVELQLAGDGRWGTAGKRHVDGAASRRLRYVHHDDDGSRLRRHMKDPVTELDVVAVYEMRPGIPVVRTWAEATARTAQVVLEHVSSFAANGARGPFDAGLVRRAVGVDGGQPLERRVSLEARDARRAR